MQDRRNFVKLGAGSLLGLFVACRSETSDVEDPIILPTEDRSQWDWDKIQHEFSIDSDIRFFNNGTLGLSPNVVRKAVKDRMDVVNSRGAYSGSEPELKKGLSALLGVEDEELAFPHNVTEGVNIAVWSLDLKPGDEVILTDHEHVGNAVPWLNRKRIDGIEIKVLELPTTQEECLVELKKLVTPKTKVIAVPHVTCTTGQVLPIKEICAFAQQNGIRTLIDGAHGVGMMKLDLHDLGCDMYASCGHKWLLGPKGTGILYVRKEIIAEMDARFVGSYSDTGWTIAPDKSQMNGLQDTAHRFYYGTQNSALHVGMTEAVRFIESIGQERIENRIRNLNQLIFNELKAISTFEIISPSEEISRCGMISFVASPETLPIYAKMKKLRWIIRYVPESDLNCIRVSTHIYNSEDQILQLVQALKTA